MNLKLLNDIKENYSDKRSYDRSTIKMNLEEKQILQHPGDMLLDKVTKYLMEHQQLNIQGKASSMDVYYELAKTQMELFFILISTEEGVSEGNQKICLDIISSSYDDKEWSYEKLVEQLHKSSAQNVEQLCNIMEDSVRMAIFRKKNIKIEDLNIDYSKHMLLAAYDIEVAIKMQIANKSKQYCNKLIQEGRLPQGMVMSKIYTNDQLDFIANQWEVFRRLREEKNIKNSDIKIKDRKVLLKKGDLIHGMDFYRENVLESIAKTGILAGELVGISEDGETFGCADFYKVCEDTTLEDALNNIKSKVPNSKRNIEDSKVAFIIQQVDAQRVEQLSGYDAYANTEKGRLVKNVVNEAGLPLTSENGAAIIVGLPANLISIVVVGRLLEKEPQKLSQISRQFPQSTVVSVDGRILIRKRDEVNNSDGDR